MNAGRPKIFHLMMGMMEWGINGRTFDMEDVTELETVRAGTREIWEFRNESGMMQMPHAIHVHGLQFRVVERSANRRYEKLMKEVREGYTDEGWKDTVLVMPGERVRILVGIPRHPGLFLYHCHMLEHEDSGMMRNYLIKA